MDGTVPQARRRMRTLFSCLVAAGCSATAEPPPSDGPNATVVAVIDGDTIDVDIGGQRERVRLLGIDTPEVAHAATADRPATDGECFGVEATAYTQQLLPTGTPVRLERDVVARDHYGRILAHVHRGALYVNAEIVRRGYATPLFIEPNRVHRDRVVGAAVAAEADDLGLWSSCE